jgi:hypothetical protein
MAKIDELIRKQQEEVNKAKDDDKPLAQAKLDALKDAKAAGIEMDNDEVNGFVTRKTNEAADKWKDLVGMDYDEAEKLFEDLEDDTVRTLLGTGNSGDGEGEDDKPVIERVQSALRERDQKIRAGEEYTQGLARDLYSERVENRLKSALGSVTLDDGTKVSLKDGRFDRVRALVGEGDLVKKLMDGETVEAGAFTERAKALYDDMPEIFDSGGGGGGNGAKTVAGHKIVEEAVRPHIPATPDGQQGAEITDEDRAARASSVY